MSDEQSYTVSEMVRQTSDNTNKFLIQVADHIEKLEATIIEQNQIIIELENKNEA